MFRRDLKATVFRLVGDEAVRANGARLQGLQQVVEALANRSTSDSTDELICVATLLDTPGMAEVRVAASDLRTQLFWKKLEESNGIPPGILFWRYECHHLPGFRWAPASFLGHPEQGFPIEGPDRQLALGCTFQALRDRGLQAQCLGMKFRKSEALHMHKHFRVMGVEDEDWAFLIEKYSPKTKGNSSEAKDDSSETKDESSKTKDDLHRAESFLTPLELEDNLNMALIFSRDPRAPSGYRLDPIYITLLYIIDESKDGIIFVRRGPGSGVCHSLKEGVVATATRTTAEDLRKRSTLEESLPASEPSRKHFMVLVYGNCLCLAFVIILYHLFCTNT